jgi:hypothetical protein
MTSFGATPTTTASKPAEEVKTVTLTEPDLPTQPMLTDQSTAVNDTTLNESLYRSAIENSLD